MTHQLTRISHSPNATPAGSPAGTAAADDSVGDALEHAAGGRCFGPPSPFSGENPPPNAPRTRPRAARLELIGFET